MSGLNKVIVVDICSEKVSVGFAGGESPECLCQNVVGTSKTKPNETIAGSVDEVVDARYPVKHDIVVDMEGLVLVVEHAFKQLSISPKGRSLLVGVTVNTPPDVREQIIRTFYDHFECGSLFVAINEVLAMYANGLMDGFAILCRKGLTACAPNLEGFAIKGACNTVDSNLNLKDALCKSIKECQAQKGDKKTNLVVKNIIVCGENGKSVDIDSIKTAATSTAPNGAAVNVKLSETEHVCWIGGSLLGALAQYSPLPVLKSDFETKGMKYTLEKMA